MSQDDDIGLKEQVGDDRDVVLRRSRISVQYVYDADNHRPTIDQRELGREYLKKR